MRKRPGMYIGSTGLGGPAPPDLGGRRQLRRRGDGRLLQPHRRHAPGRRRLPGRRRRSRHPGRPVPLRPAQGQERGRGRADRAARRRQVRRRRLQGLRRPPRRRRVGRQRAVGAARHRGRPGRHALPPGVRQGRQAAGQAGAWSAHAAAGPHAAPPSPSGPTRPSSAEGTEFHARTVLERLQTMAFLNKGLEIQFIDERPDKEQTVSYLYKGGIVDFVKHLNASKEALFSQVAASSAPRTTRRSRSPCSGTRATTRASTASPTASPPPRAACTWRASRPRSPSVVNKYARAKQPAQGEGGQPPRRGHPGGPHGHHLGASSATRSSRARPRPSSATSRPARWCRRPPTRSWPSGSRRTPPRPTASSRRPSPRRRPASRPRTRATPSGARPRSSARACPTS